MWVGGGPIALHTQLGAQASAEGKASSRASLGPTPVARLLRRSCRHTHPRRPSPGPPAHSWHSLGDEYRASWRALLKGWRGQQQCWQPSWQRAEPRPSWWACVRQYSLDAAAREAGAGGGRLSHWALWKEPPASGHGQDVQAGQLLGLLGCRPPRWPGVAKPGARSRICRLCPRHPLPGPPRSREARGPAGCGQAAGAGQCLLRLLDAGRARPCSSRAAAVGGGGAVGFRGPGAGAAPVAPGLVGQK